MEFRPRQILETLAKHGVDFVLVGATGAALYGAPNITDDVDIVPDLKKSNLEALAGALNALNARIMSPGEPEGIEVDFTGKQLQKWIVDFRFLNLMTDLGQLDIIHRPSGTRGYSDLATNAEKLEVGDVEIRVAALEDIIRSKEAVSRDRDRAQLPTLRMLLEKRRNS